MESTQSLFTVRYLVSEGVSKLLLVDLSGDSVAAYFGDMEIINPSINVDLPDENLIVTEKYRKLLVGVNTAISFFKIIESINEDELCDYDFEFDLGKGKLRFLEGELFFAHPDQKIVFEFLESLIVDHDKVTTIERDDLIVGQGVKWQWCKDQNDWCIVYDGRKNMVPDQFSLNQKEFFWTQNPLLFIEWISAWYPIPEDLLMRFPNLWEWISLSGSPLINWSAILVRTFKDKIHWDLFCRLHHLPYEDKTDGDYYAGLDWQNMNWSSESEFRSIVCDSYVNAFPERKIRFRIWPITMIPPVPYSQICFFEHENTTTSNSREHELPIIQLIEEFDGEIPDQDNTAIPTSIIRNTYYKLNWVKLSENWKLDWNFSLLFEFEQLWNYNNLETNRAAFQGCLKEDLSDNWIEKIISDFDDHDYQLLRNELLEHESKLNRNTSTNAPF